MTHRDNFETDEVLAFGVEVFEHVTDAIFVTMADAVRFIRELE